MFVKDKKTYGIAFIPYVLRSFILNDYYLSLTTIGGSSDVVCTPLGITNPNSENDNSVKITFLNLCITTTPF